MADSPIIGPDAQIYLLNKVATLAGYLDRRGIGEGLLLEGTGISVSALRDHTARVSRRQLFAVIRNFIRVAPDDHCALDAGASFHISNYGFYGYALLSSASCRDAVEFAITYRQLAAPTMDMRIAVSGSDAAWELTPLADVDQDLSIQRFTYDFQCAVNFALHRSIFGADFRFLSIDLPLCAPDYADRYESMFGCPVRFRAPAGQMHFLTQWLDRRPVGSDPITHAMVKELCDDMLLKIFKSEGIVGDIHNRLIRHPGSFPNLEQMAAALHVGARTLRRRLRAEGRTYQQVVDEVRLQLAIKYLQDTHMSQEHIASRLKFSGAANFRRAFRRWTGQGPGQVRSAARRKMS
jgi:AraC-like DNA-binding protein